MWSQNRLNKLRQLGWSDWGLLMEAAVWLAVSRFSLLFIPFRRIAPRLGTLQCESTATVLPVSEQIAEQIGWAVRAVAKRTPWESACLAQAISAKRMLRRRNIASTLYLGLAKNDAEQLQAHAWLRCGKEIITGKAGHEQFSVISYFAEPEDKQNNKTKTVDLDKVQALLLATLHPNPSLETAVHLQHLSEDEWQLLIETAQKQFIATLLYARLDTVGLQTAVPPTLWTKLHTLHKQITLQNLATYRELTLINHQLQAENIPMVVLKGGFLATAVYPHIGQRTMGDLDLLVPREDVTKTITILQALGWQESRPITLNATMEQHHHLPPFAKDKVNITVEPHWHIVHPGRAYSIDADELWQHVMPCHIAGSEMLAFQPHLQLLHLALHASYNHQFTFDLRSLCDIVLLIGQSEPILRWDLVVDCAKKWKWQRGVYLTLALINEFWETAVPATVLAQLKPENMPKNLLPLTKELLLQGRTVNKQLSRNFSQLSNDKSWGQKAKFALGFLIPSRKQLAWRYGVSVKSSKIWFYYLINFRDMIRRNANRFWQLLRGSQMILETAERRNQLSSWLEQS